MTDNNAALPSSRIAARTLTAATGTTVVVRNTTASTYTAGNTGLGTSGPCSPLPHLSSSPLPQPTSTRQKATKEGVDCSVTNTDQHREHPQQLHKKKKKQMQTPAAEQDVSLHNHTPRHRSHHHHHHHHPSSRIPKEATDASTLDSDYPAPIKKYVGRMSPHHGQRGKTSHGSGVTDTDEIPELIRNPLAFDSPVSSVDVSPRHTPSSTKRTLSSVPSSPHQHRPHRHRSNSGHSSRSSSSSPSRHNTAVASDPGNASDIAKGSHKKILPPSPIVVDAHVRSTRKKTDGGSGSGVVKSAPVYPNPPPFVTERSISCPSPPSGGTGSPARVAPASPYLDRRKDDIVLPPTRSSAAARARSTKQPNTVASTSSPTTAISTTATSTKTSNYKKDSETDKHRFYPASDQIPSKDVTCPPYESTSSTSASVTGDGLLKTSGEIKHKSSSSDRRNLSNLDSSFIQNFYKTNQKLVELRNSQPLHSKNRIDYNITAGMRCGYNTSPSLRSTYTSNYRKNTNYSHTLGSSNHGYTDYKGNYSSYSKDSGYGSAGNTSDYGSYSSKSGGYHRGKVKNYDKKMKGSCEEVYGVEEKPNRPSSKDHVYYTADRPSRSKIPTSSGSSHRASSVPARRSMSVSEFASVLIDPSSPSNGQSEGENLEKVKSKLMSMWNNVKYGWTLNRKTSFRYDSPIFLLGEHYHRRHDDEVDGKGKESTQNNRVNNMELFKLDFASRLWFTYRRDFEPFKGTKFTTDCGWGCMIRSGQMMLAQGFITHFFGRGWRIQHRDKDLNVYRQIIKWFADYQQCPFSVHQLVDIGSTLGRKPGEWYGPATVATMLRIAMEKSYECQPVLREVCVYVSSDCTVYTQDVADLCMSSNNNTLLKMPNDSEGGNAENHEVPEPDTGSRWKRAVVILIPVRLGGEALNSVYIPCLQSLLAEEHCIGIIGGKPKHSLYFVGWQDKKLIYFDPHYCQDNIDVMSGDFPFSSFHCATPRKLPFEDMDPSCTIGFYCRNQTEFEKFVNQSKDLKEKGLYPAFAFVDGRSGDLEMDKLELNEERYLRIRYVDQDGKMKQPASESDDFVVL
ncbi:flocculation protein FLO11-like [Argonauta hians]